MSRHIVRVVVKSNMSCNAAWSRAKDGEAEIVEQHDTRPPLKRWQGEIHDDSKTAAPPSLSSSAPPSAASADTSQHHQAEAVSTSFGCGQRLVAISRSASVRSMMLSECDAPDGECFRPSFLDVTCNEQGGAGGTSQAAKQEACGTLSSGVYTADGASR